MSVWRRLLLFPVTRLVIWLLVTLLIALPGQWLAGLLPYSGLLVPAVAMAAVVLGLAFLARVVERRPVAAVGLGARGLASHTLLGFLLGGGLLAAVIGVMALAGWYRIESVTWNWGLLGLLLYHYLQVAVQEEVGLRAVFFRVFEDRYGSYISLAISALLFGLLHIFNPNATLAAALAIAIEAGILLAAAFMLTRSLWLAIGIHWGWNFVQGPLFGAAVSGGQGQSLIKSVITGPEWATGGAFGPEGGLIALALCTAAGVVLLVMAHRRGQVMAPVWRRDKGEAPV